MALGSTTKVAIVSMEVAALGFSPLPPTKISRIQDTPGKLETVARFSLLLKQSKDYIKM